MKQVRVGLALPFESDVVRFARDAERFGFDYVAAPEHLAFHAPVPNSFVWLSVAAGATTSIGLVSAVALLPLYPAVLFTKLVASLDYLSGARFTVGVGVGGEYPAEFRASGIPMSERGARADEALSVMEALLGSAEPVGFAGRWTSFDGIRIEPKRLPGRPPIWVGGRREASMRRAARSADLWMPYMLAPADVAAGAARVREFAHELGRDPEGIETGLYAFAVISDDEDGGREQAIGFTSQRYKQDFRPLAGRFLVGSPDRVAARMCEYVGAGVSCFILELACGPAEYHNQMGRLMREVLPQVAAAAKPPEANG